MKLFSTLLLIHILAAIVWLGAGITTDVLVQNATKTKDKNKIKQAIANNAMLSQQLFAPAGIISLLSGILMVIVGKRINFSDLWITIALVGIFIAIVHGVFVVSKYAKDFDKLDVKSKHFNAAYGKFVFASKTSMAILVVVLLDMVMKPSSNYMSFILYSAIIFVVILLVAKKQSTFLN